MATSAISLQSAALVMAADHGWHLRIGDPSAIGWLTVAAYLVAAYLAHTAHRACQNSARALNSVDPLEAENHRLLARLWIIVATVMLLLGVNKQFALLSFFLEPLRDFAQQDGWYGERYRYQAHFIWVTVFLGVLGMSLMLYWLRSVIRRVLGAVLALNFMVSFVIIRGSSFHPIDLILYGRDSYWNLVFEFGGICAVAMSAQLARRAGRSS